MLLAFRLLAASAYTLYAFVDGQLWGTSPFATLLATGIVFGGSYLMTYWFGALMIKEKW